MSNDWVICDNGEFNQYSSENTEYLQISNTNTEKKYHEVDARKKEDSIIDNSEYFGLKNSDIKTFYELKKKDLEKIKIKQSESDLQLKLKEKEEALKGLISNKKTIKMQQRNEIFSDLQDLLQNNQNESQHMISIIKEKNKNFINNLLN